MNKENMAVLTNIIGAVESGGQVYGKRRYDAYAAPYTNSPIEHTVTLGWAQNYGNEAYRLISLIYAHDPAAFERIDTGGKVRTMINGEHDWVRERWNPDAAGKAILIRLINSPAGRECQDELFTELMEKYILDCEKDYTKDVKAGMMYCEIRHLGGKSAADRIFKRCKGDYSLDAIMAALKKDQDDKTGSNQAGDAKFWSRHTKCREFIEKYAVGEQDSPAAADTNGEGIGMAKTAERLINQARSWIGCKESDGSHKKIIDIYNGHKPLARGYKVRYTDAWCAAFVSACAIKTGMTDIIPAECGCPEMAALFRKLGEWDEDDARVPKTGDIIFYDWQDSGSGDNTGTPDHVGIVEKVSGSTITVIEGNYRDAVRRRTLKVDGRYNRGYGVPKYAKDNTSSTAIPKYKKTTASSSALLRKGSTGTAVKEMQDRLIAAGYSCGKAGADGDFGSDTLSALLKFQKDHRLEADGIYGPLSRAALVQAVKDAQTDRLAREVIAGRWGTGEARKQELTAAGYDYAAVQKRVNAILRG